MAGNNMVIDDPTQWWQARSGLVLGVGAAVLVAGGATIHWSRTDPASTRAGDYALIGTGMGALFILLGVYLRFKSTQQQADLARLLAGEDLLARWTVTYEEWKAYLVREKARAFKDAFRQLYHANAYLIATFVLAAVMHARKGIYFPATWSNTEILAAFVGIMLAIDLILFLAVYAPAALRSTDTPEPMLIGRRGACLAGRYYSWTAPHLHFKEARVLDGPPVELEVVWLQPARKASWEKKTVRFPVPPGSEAEARAIVSKIGA